MSLDTIDAAFSRRWHAVPRPAVPAVSRTDVTPEPPLPAPEPPLPAAERPVPAPAAAPACATPCVVDRLLAEATPQWHAIADRIEAARHRGRRIVAVAGCLPGEGRTTIVTALVRVLQSRGRETRAVAPDELANVGGSPHDKRIILVDAGVWFPPGPIRRPRLLVMSHGCEAAILVRRADHPPLGAVAAALEAIGIEPLGEVLTFASGAESPSGAACP